MMETRPTKATINIESTTHSGAISENQSEIHVHVSKRECLSSALESVTPSSLDSIDILIPNNLLDPLFDPLSLAGLVLALRPNSTLKINLSGSNGASSDLGVINTAFLLSGLNPESERREKDGSRTVVARKGAAQSSASALNLEEKTNEDYPKMKWSQKLALDDLDLEDEEFVDEDELLEEFAPPPMRKGVAKKEDDDCGGRKACDNCTCGRAEKEAGIASPRQVSSSACGKCPLGDAFRCASCPFLGKPAFKPGQEKLVLNLMDDIVF